MKMIKELFELIADKAYPLLCVLTGAALVALFVVLATLVGLATGYSTKESAFLLLFAVMIVFVCGFIGALVLFWWSDR